jgi:hypothetical protein
MGNSSCFGTSEGKKDSCPLPPPFEESIAEHKTELSQERLRIEMEAKIRAEIEEETRQKMEEEKRQEEKRQELRRENVSKIPEIMEYCYKALGPYYTGNTCKSPTVLPGLEAWLNTLDSSYVCTYSIVWARYDSCGGLSRNLWTYIVTEKAVFGLTLSGIYEPTYGWYPPTLAYSFDEPLSSNPIVAQMIRSYCAEPYNYVTHDGSSRFQNLWQDFEKRFFSLIHSIPGFKP